MKALSVSPPYQIRLLDSLLEEVGMPALPRASCAEHQGGCLSTPGPSSDSCSSQEEAWPSLRRLQILLHRWHPSHTAAAAGNGWHNQSSPPVGPASLPPPGCSPSPNMAFVFVFWTKASFITQVQGTEMPGIKRKTPNTLIYPPLFLHPLYLLPGNFLN